MSIFLFIIAVVLVISGIEFMFGDDEASEQHERIRDKYRSQYYIK